MKLSFAVTVIAVLPTGTQARIGTLQRGLVDDISPIVSFERGLRAFERALEPMEESCDKIVWKRAKYEWPGHGNECQCIANDEEETPWSDCQDEGKCCYGYKDNWKGGRHCVTCTSETTVPNPFGDNLYIPPGCEGDACDPNDAFVLVTKANPGPDQGEFPHLGQLDHTKPPPGYDNSIGVLIKDDYMSTNAVEIESTMVVCGDFKRGPNGVNDINHVGAGSGYSAKDDKVVLHGKSHGCYRNVQKQHVR